MSNRLSGYLRSNVLGLVAIFIALGGVSWAATALERNSVKSKHIKDGQVRSADVLDDGLTGADIDEASLETVPFANDAETLDGLDSLDLQRRVDDGCAPDEAIQAIGADGSVICIAGAAGDITGITAGQGLTGGGSVGDVTLALANCPDGEILKRASGSWACSQDDDSPSGPAGGDLAGNYPDPTLRPAEALRYVGGTDQPAFANGWGNYGSFHQGAAFYKDRTGVVHLSGLVNGGTYGSPDGAGRIFTLPNGYAPCSKNPGGGAIADLVFVALTAGGVGRISIYDGLDKAYVGAEAGSGWISLDGMSWRATGC